ncbi:MAG: restriction endonuclease subunit S [Methylococcales bacterium]
MSFPRYESYKDSGVEWLGEVPAHWNIRRIASIFSESHEMGNVDLPVLSVSINWGISDYELGDEDRHRIVNQIEDKTAYKRVRPGDLVYNMMRAWQGAFGVAIIDGLVSPAYVVARPNKKIHSSYFESLFRIPMYIEEFRRASKGIADFRQRLYWEHFRQVKVVFPPLDEQIAIAAFLDRETGKIDALISEQQRLIELLKEKRQSVISRAVTKGLNPAAPMKDSGIEWLGEVPEHWALKRLKRNLRLLTEKTSQRDNPVALENVESWSGRFIQTETLFEGEGIAFERGDILFGKLRPYLAKAYLTENTGEAIGDFHVLRPTNDIDSRFSQYQILNREFIAIVDGSTFGAKMPRVNWEFLGNIVLTTPPLVEQQTIAAFLDRETAKIDALIAEQQRAITLLQERRAALISAAVTGKIDVRKWNNPGDADLSRNQSEENIPINEARA